jgi:argininosuccinate lyase
MGTILVPLFTHYRPAAPLVQAAYAEGLQPK